MTDPRARLPSTDDPNDPRGVAFGFDTGQGEKIVAFALCRNGDILVRGELVINDLEIVDGFRDWLKRARTTQTFKPGDHVVIDADQEAHVWIVVSVMGTWVSLHSVAEGAQRTAGARFSELSRSLTAQEVIGMSDEARAKHPENESRDRGSPHGRKS